MGKYLKLFETENDRNTYEGGNDYIEPYVSYVEGDNSVHYNKPPFFCKLTLSNGDVVEIEGSGELASSMLSQYKPNLVSTEIGELCTSIGMGAFGNCSGLTSVVIPNSVTSMDNGAFNTCSELTSIIIPNSVTSMGMGTFYNCSGLTSITISNSITSIGNQTFSNCISLTSVTIPNSVTTMGAAVFMNCSGLTSVTIPNSVTSIGNAVFYGCSGLTSITIEATTPPTLGGDVFDNTNNCPIYVPSASVDAYKAASGWSTYASRIQAIP